jgi:hypothetical protein
MPFIFSTDTCPKCLAYKIFCCGKGIYFLSPKCREFIDKQDTFHLKIYRRASELKSMQSQGQAGTQVNLLSGSPTSAHEIARLGNDGQAGSTQPVAGEKPANERDK